MSAFRHTTVFSFGLVSLTIVLGLWGLVAIASGHGVDPTFTPLSSVPSWPFAVSSSAIALVTAVSGFTLLTSRDEQSFRTNPDRDLLASAVSTRRAHLARLGRIEGAVAATIGVVLAASAISASFVGGTTHSVLTVISVSALLAAIFAASASAVAHAVLRTLTPSARVVRAARTVAPELLDSIDADRLRRKVPTRAVEA